MCKKSKKKHELHLLSQISIPAARSLLVARSSGLCSHDSRVFTTRCAPGASGLQNLAPVAQCQYARGHIVCMIPYRTEWRINCSQLGNGSTAQQTESTVGQTEQTSRHEKTVGTSRLTAWRPSFLNTVEKDLPTINSEGMAFYQV